MTQKLHLGADDILLGDLGEACLCIGRSLDWTCTSPQPLHQEHPAYAFQKTPLPLLDTS